MRASERRCVYVSKREKASVQSHEWAQHTSVCRTCHSPRSNIYRVPILCAPIPCARSFRHNRALSVSNTHDSHRLFPHLSVSPPLLSLSLGDLSTVNAPHFCNLVVTRGEKPRQDHVLDLYVRGIHMQTSTSAGAQTNTAPQDKSRNTIRERVRHEHTCAHLLTRACNIQV